jgi:hypothetical protein
MVMYNNKTISPVVASSLLVIVAVITIISFQGWFHTYSSSILTNVEEKNTQNCLITTEGLIDNQLYLKSSCTEELKYLELNDEIGNNLCSFK